MQQRFDPADFGSAREEHQQRASIRPQAAQDSIGDLPFDRLTGVAAEITRFDRERAATALDDWRVAEQRGNPRAVERR